MSTNVIVTEHQIPIRGIVRTIRLYRPGTAEAVPALVFIHGSGGGSHEALRDEAECLAATGIAMLVPDKVMDGYGNFRRDYAALADDAVEAAMWLRAQSGIDPDRIGAFGYSEGTWIAIDTAARRPDLLTRIVLASGPIVTPGEQIRHHQRNLDRRRHPADRAIRAAWWWTYTKLTPYCRYDAVRCLANLSCPIYAVWGTNDISIDVPLAKATLDGATNTLVSTVVLPGRGHYLGTVEQWLNDLADWVKTA